MSARRTPGSAERPVLRPELFEAEEIFTAATASEITPVVTVDGAPLGNGRSGPITTSIRNLHRDVVYAESSLLSAMRVEVTLP